MVDVLNERIAEEIKQAEFVAVMVDEWTDFSNITRLSYVLRNATGARVKEWFVKLLRCQRQKNLPMTCQDWF